jgi:hypothetical protein
VINAPEKFAGKRTKCPGCKAPITIPALEPEVLEEDTIEVDPADETVDVAAEKPKKGKGKSGGKKIGGPKGKSKLGGGPKGKLGKSGSIKKGRSSAKASAPPKKRSKSEDADEAPAKSNKMLYTIIGAAVLLLAIGAGAYFFFMNGGSEPSSTVATKASKPDATPKAQVKPKLTTMDLIPANSAGLGGFNFKKLLDIPMLSEELSKEEDDAQKIDEFFANLEDNETTKQLRAEIEKDGAVAALKKRFDKITFAFEAPEDMAAPSPEIKGVAVLKTSMDATSLMKDIFNMIKEKTGVKELEGDYEGYQFKNEKGEEASIASIGNDMILMGTSAQVNAGFALVEDPDSKESIQFNEGLMAKARGIQDSILWVAFKNPKGAPEEKMSEPAPAAAGAMAPPFQGDDLESMLLSIDYENDTLKIGIELGFYDAAKVQSSNMMLAGFAPMGLGMMGIPPQQLKVTPDGNTLKASLELTAEMLEQVSEKASQMGQGGGLVLPPQTAPQ